MEDKTCSMCEKSQPLENFSKDATKKDGYKYICRICYRAVDRKRYYKNVARSRDVKNRTGRKMMKLYPEKWKARSLARYAIKIGTLVRMPCEVCGEMRVQAHHQDYSKPLEVRWLCSLHHAELHRIQRAQLNGGGIEK